MTVLEVIQRSSQFLAGKGVDSPRLQVELLLSHVLQRPRLELYLAFDQPLTETELARLREMIQRRGRREPLQQILGSCSFCGHEIGLSRNVLVPRPETEILAEMGWTFLRERVARCPTPPLVLDLGTGSGCLAVALAKGCPEAIVHGTDISSEALELANANVATHQLRDRVSLFMGDGFAAVPHGTRYDLIVSNPPYIPRGEIGRLQPEVRDYEPWGALDGGEDGLEFYRRLTREASGYLAAEGCWMVEIGDGQETDVGRIARENGWRIESIQIDYAGKPRILTARLAD